MPGGDGEGGRDGGGLHVGGIQLMAPIASIRTSVESAIAITIANKANTIFVFELLRGGPVDSASSAAVRMISAGSGDMKAGRPRERCRFNSKRGFGSQDPVETPLTMLT